MSLNQLINPIEEGLDIVLNKLNMNNDLVLKCPLDEQNLILNPPIIGANGDVLIRSGSNNVEFVAQNQLLTRSQGLYMITNEALTVTGTVEKSLLQGVTSVGSLTVPANGFEISSYHLNVSGAFNSANGNTITIHLKANNIILGTVIATLVSTTSQFFEIETDFSIKKLGGAGVAKIVSNFDFTYSDIGTSGFRGNRAVSINNSTFDTTINNSLDITAFFSTTSVANSIACYSCILNRIY